MGVVREIDVASPVGVLIVLKPTLHALRQGLDDILVARPNGAIHTLVCLHGIGEGHVGAVWVFLLCLREDARPIYSKVLGQMMRTLQVGGEDALRLRHGASLVVLGVSVRTDVLGTDAVVVAKCLRVSANVHVVPFQLMVAKRQVYLGVCSSCEVVDAIVAMVQTGNVHCLFARSHLY